MSIRRILSLATLMIVLGIAGPEWGQSARAGMVSSIWFVSVDTTSLAGTTGAIEYSFIPGDLTASPATATITAFTTDGTLGGTPMVSGDVTGTLPAPVIAMNDQTFNDYFETFTYGSQLSFFVTLAASAPSSIPIDTTFSFFLYDQNGNPISNSSSPSGEALDLNIDGLTGVATLVGYFPPPPIVVLAGVPEPSGVLLLGLGGAVLAGLGWLRRGGARAEIGPGRLWRSRGSTGSFRQASPRWPRNQSSTS